MTPIRIRLLWHPQAQFAGYLLAAQQRLGAPAVSITCVPMSAGLGPIEALVAGDVEFSVASPSHLLESPAAEDLVLLLAIQQRSALVYPARRSAGIAHLSDLVGHKAGVWPGHEDLELRWMLRRAGVELDTIDFVPMNDTVAGLLDHHVDLAQMTDYHEIHHLEHAAGSLEPFVMFRASDVGAALLKDGLIARRDWVERHPEETQAVVDAVLAGWTRALSDPQEAIAACLLARPEMDEAEHRRQLADIRTLILAGPTLTDGLGYPDPEHMIRAAEAMACVHDEPTGLAIERSVDTRFWAAAPPASRRRAW